MKYGLCQCGEELVYDDGLVCVECGDVDIGWLVYTRWPSGKMSLLGRTFWATDHGFSEANRMAADYVDYFAASQATGKSSRHGSVTPGTTPVMKRVQRAL